MEMFAHTSINCWADLTILINFSGVARIWPCIYEIKIAALLWKWMEIFDRGAEFFTGTQVSQIERVKTPEKNILKKITKKDFDNTF